MRKEELEMEVEDGMAYEIKEEMFGSPCSLSNFESEQENGDSRLSQSLLMKRTNYTSQLAIVGAKVSAIESLDYEYSLSLFYLNFFFCYSI